MKTCKDFGHLITAAARRESVAGEDRYELESHLSRCEDCRNRLAEQTRLSGLLADIAAGSTPASAGIPAGLAQEFRRRQVAHTMRQRVRWAGAAVAASIVIAVGLSTHFGFLVGRTKQHLQTAVLPSPPSQVLSAHTTQFMPLPFARPFRRDEQVTMYRVQMPEAALTSFGLPIDGQRANTGVVADVLVGQDGIARAIRFVE